MKKALSLAISLLLLVSSAFCVYADGGYGDNYGSVDDDLVDLPKLQSTVYRINDGNSYLGGITAGTLRVNASKNFEDCSPYVYFEKADGTELPLDEPVKTGDKVRYRVGNDVYDARTVVINGDINGDSELTVTDITAAINCAVNALKSNFQELTAADCDNNGKITAYDIVKLRAEVLGNEEKDMVDYSKKTIILADEIDNFKTQGRISNTDEGIALDFTASSFEFTAACKGDVTVKFSQAGSKDYGVIVDGGTLVKKNLNTGNVLTVAENLEEGVHTFKIVKNQGPSETVAYSVTLNGTVCRRNKAAEKCIEIIGDSITCGAANTIHIKDGKGNYILHDEDGTIERVTLKFTSKTDENVFEEYDTDWQNGSNTTAWNILEPTGKSHSFNKSEYTATEVFYDKDGKEIASVPYLSSDNNDYVQYTTNGVTGYSYLLPNMLGYDYNIFCESGNQIEVLSRVYNKQYVRRSYKSATASYDEHFRNADNTLTTNVDEASDYVPTRDPDVVFINMDTNSSCTTTAYKEAMQKFVDMFKARNPEVKIIFGYGSMKQTWVFKGDHNAIKANVAEMGGEENNIYLFELPALRDGGGGHPSVANDRTFATKLAEFIKNIED